MLNKYDVIQFNENHKWCGAYGYINEIKQYDDGRIRYMIGVPVLKGNGVEGSAFIFVTDDENSIEYVGTSVMIPESGDD